MGLQLLVVQNLALEYSFSLEKHLLKLVELRLEFGVERYSVLHLLFLRFRDLVLDNESWLQIEFRYREPRNFLLCGHALLRKVPKFRRQLREIVFKAVFLFGVMHETLMNFAESTSGGYWFEGIHSRNSLPGPDTVPFDSSRSLASR